MNPDINHILHHFFQKKTLEDVHVVDIEQMVNEYPYFAPAQYLLAKKYLQTDHEAYLKQAKKTALFFNNPHWLNSMLHADEIRLDDEGWIDNGGLTVSTETLTPPLVDEAVQEIEEIVAVEVIEENKVIVVEEDNTVAQYEKPREEIAGVVFMEEVNTAADDVIENKPEDTVVEEVLPVETAISTVASTETVFSTTEPLVTEFDDASTDNPEPVSENIISVPKLKLILNQDVPPETGAGSIIPIEPLYTIDYFASQGIKADAGTETKDKLSVKLRSFTDWLKTMKRIHPEKFDTEMDAGSQSAIQHIAEHSNESKEIVTETMAEVFARQGLHKKAAEVYHKLSLLNPDKRVYFAAKIAQLKET
jgi:hypothetical protein